MPVNLNQYGGIVGVFNIRFIYIKQHNIVKNAFSQSKIKQTIAKEIFSVFASFSIFLTSISWSFINLLWIKARFINLIHCVESVRIQSYSGLYFSAFGRNNSEYGHFSRNVSRKNFLFLKISYYLCSINIHTPYLVISDHI